MVGCEACVCALRMPSKINTEVIEVQALGSIIYVQQVGVYVHTQYKFQIQYNCTLYSIILHLLVTHRTVSCSLHDKGLLQGVTRFCSAGGQDPLLKTCTLLSQSLTSYTAVNRLQIC